MKEEDILVVYDKEQASATKAYIATHPTARVVCVDSWAERALSEVDVPFSSLKAADTDDEGMWWVMAQDAAREWYRLPAMSFFSHTGIPIGEALEPMLAVYLSQVLYYARLYRALAQASPDVSVRFFAPIVGAGASAGPLAYFEGWAAIDGARMAQLNVSVEGYRPVPRVHLSSRSFWRSLVVRLYNSVIRLAPHRRMKLFASEYWSHIAPVMGKMDDVELVLMEAGELRNIPWRQLWKHRVQVRHPGDMNALTRQTMQECTGAFLNGWEMARGTVGDYFSEQCPELDWSPVISACGHLVAYGARVAADSDALKRILEEERPDVILQFASVGGRMHHFLLLARAAKELRIPSVELQHAGAYIDPRSAYSRLETAYLAAYGPYVRQWYVRNGYGSERIVPIGSPRFDRYALFADSLGEKGNAIVAALGLDPMRPILFAAVPPQEPQLNAFDSRELSAFFNAVCNVGQMLHIQVLFKFRKHHATSELRAYIKEQFGGGVAIADSEDISALLSASDAVITGNSTVIYEALLARKPLVLYPWKRFDTHHAEMYKMAAPLARTEDELLKVMQRIVSEPEYGEEIVAQGQRFLEGYLFDGRSSERLAEFLERIVKESHEVKYCSAVDLTKELTFSKDVRYEIRAALKDDLYATPVPFSAFREFYESVVPVQKTDEVWNKLIETHSAFIAYHGDTPVSGAAFVSNGTQMYYSMAVTDFASPYAKHAGYLLQKEAMEHFKTSGCTFYVLGVLAREHDSEKLKQISQFKEKLGTRYVVEGEHFPFASYTPVYQHEP